MIKALRIKDFPDYYITDIGDVYSRRIVEKHSNTNGRIFKKAKIKTILNFKRKVENSVGIEVPKVRKSEQKRKKNNKERIPV